MSDDLLSAEVLLVPASPQVGPGRPTTVANLRDALPDPGRAAAARRAFRRAGFEVSHVGGASFSISARRTHFEAVFGVPLDVTSDDRGRTVVGGPEGSELPTTWLDHDVADVVRAITFTRPPDFGAGSGQGTESFL